jgi:hypothetical protein
VLVGEATAVDLVEQEADGALMDRHRQICALKMRRQVLEADGLPVRKGDDLIEYAREFAQVAGPVVPCEGIASAARDEGSGTVPALLEHRRKQVIEEAFSKRERRKAQPSAHAHHRARDEALVPGAARESHDPREVLGALPWNELLEYMVGFHAQLPGAYFVTQQFFSHHRCSVARWKMVNAENLTLDEGISHAEYDDALRLQNVSGFFTPPKGSATS